MKHAGVNWHGRVLLTTWKFNSRLKASAGLEHVGGTIKGLVCVQGNIKNRENDTHMHVT